ncbi:hypothetical protein YA0002_05875 [Pseudomonas cichorii]|uniref:hypothetical protein n=1 Tax=Pseudomonas cichorii TaxID=36746 RepID=UPI0018E5E3D6|nr:hypothetical protein [Pseudomonas cichorii]MBI6852288.1 hypothetical protein [Pseudomonas cichorii]
MIDFDQAVSIAYANIEKLVPGAKNIVLEGAIISDDGKQYEVTYSYDLDRPNLTNPALKSDTGLYALANLLGKRKEYKIFLVDINGKFRGFKRYKEE